MTHGRLVAELTADAVLYSLAASVVFLVGYVVFAAGYRTAIGRTLIALDGGLVALYVPSVLHRFFGLRVTEIGFAWYYLGTVVLVGSAVWWRTAIMFRAQHRGERHR